MGLVCLVMLTLVGCGGDSDPTAKPVPLTVGTGTTATEPQSTESNYRAKDFTFTLPAGWAEEPSISAESYGQAASAASVAPVGTAPSSLVLVLAYDIRGQPTESPDGPRAWFDWYARTNDAEITGAAREIGFAGGKAWQGSLNWTDDVGSPVEVSLVRAARGDILYLIQCAAEPADRETIAAGCATIVSSFRATR